MSIPERSQIEFVIKKAGSVVMSFFGKPLELKEKPDEQGLVSKADTDTEDYLVQALGELLPGSCFVAEESGASGGQKEYCWVIDPLDGTTNFTHGIPYFSISVALARNGVPFIGVVYNPATQELFYSQKDVGSFLNGQPISVSHTEKLGKAIVDMAQVACGRLDGVVFADLAWWDAAAGMVLIEQAGGVVSEFDGSSLREGYQTCLAANSPVHTQLTAILGDSSL